jgi:hypothetical protein
MGKADLISVTEAAKRLGITPEAAFDLAFVTRQLPIIVEGNHEGIPSEAVEAYRQAHAS